MLLVFKFSESFTLLSVAKFKFPINKAVELFVPVLNDSAANIIIKVYKFLYRPVTVLYMKTRDIMRGIYRYTDR